MLLGARVLGAEAAGGRGEHPIDRGRVGRGHLAGHIPHPVDALNHSHAAFGERPPVPLLEGERFQPHHQAQQPRAQLFGAAGLCRLHRLLVDRGQGERLADAAGHPVDHCDLLGVKIAIAVGLPDGRHGC